MIAPFRKLILTVVLSLALDAQGKLPGHMYITARGGAFFSGIASEGSSFKGRSFAISAVYNPFPEAKIGMQVTAGLEANTYRHFFDDRVFIEHIHRGVTSDICAWLPVGERCRVLVGINIFLLFYREVDMGEKNYNDTYYYSNDSLMSSYKPSPVQASAVLAFDCAMGRRQQSNFGIRIAQSGNSPVQEDALYDDASGETVTISRKMKPASVQLYLSLRIAPREKRKEI